MSKRENRTMTLGEFLDRMKNGWGFARPYVVKRIGHALDKIIPAEMRDKVVQVKYFQGSSGYGPNFKYHYSWEVTGIKLDHKGGFLEAGKVEKVFGYSSLPYLHVDEDGFTVGYDYP